MIRGSVTIPARLRRELGLADGVIVGVEVSNGRVIIRRVKIVPADGERAAHMSNGRSRRKSREEAAQPV